MKISFIVYVWRGSMNGYYCKRTKISNALYLFKLLIYPRDGCQFVIKIYNLSIYFKSNGKIKL